MRIRARTLVPILAAVGVVAGLRVVATEATEATEEPPNAGGTAAAAAQVAQISGDPNKPRRHFRVRDAADVGAAEAAEIYRNMAPGMADAYATSREPAAMSYQDWPRYNTAPYRSATHGRRYANNYANEIAQAYGRFEQAGTLPVGSLLAKDSFAILADGKALPGPLFVMEKMPAGFNYVSGDWRYSMIMPDGSVFGVTKGVNAERVEYCIGCHLAAEKHDHLYFVPEDVRPK